MPHQWTPIGTPNDTATKGAAREKQFKMAHALRTFIPWFQA